MRFFGPFLQECVGDLAVDLLLPDDVLVCELGVAIKVLNVGSLAEADHLIVDEAENDLLPLIL